MHFTNLDDTPMFCHQLQCLEESAESLRLRSVKFYKGCRKYTEGLGEAYDGDIAFVSSLENFGGGHNDPHFVALGGPLMNKFTIALREITYYNRWNLSLLRPDLVLRLQIEEKKLRLLDLQTRLRDEIDQQQQEITAMPDRPYRKFVRLSDIAGES
ncbi:hypothetical protein RYX36_002856 [Vicia faba]